MFVGAFLLNSSKRLSDVIDLEPAVSFLENHFPSSFSDTWNNDSLFIYQSISQKNNTFASPPSIWAGNNIIVAGDIRLDNRSMCLNLLNTAAESESESDYTLIARLYAQYDDAFLDKIDGDFSFVIFDLNDNSLLCVRDVVGAKPFYYHCSNNILYFSTTAAAFCHLDRLVMKPNLSWVTNYLLGLPSAEDETAFSEVLRLPPAHLLYATKKTTEIKKYFSFSTSSHKEFEYNDKWIKNYRAVLDQSVKSRLNSSFFIGAETTGGLDSSTIVALASHFLPHDIEDFHTFGYVENKEEPEHVLLTSQYRGIVNNHILSLVNTHRQRTHDLNKEIELIGYPSEFYTVSAFSGFYRLCRQLGIQTLLSGYGGDEVVTNYPGKLLAIELLDAGQFVLSYKSTPGHGITKFLRFIKIFAQKVIKYDGRKNEKNYKNNKKSDAIVKEDVFDDVDIESFYYLFPRFGSYRRVNDYIVNECLHRGISNRLEHSTIIASAYQVEYRWPLLDKRLMEQYLLTPSIYKAHNGLGRYLHRKSVEDILPDKVCWKASKYMGGTSHHVQKNYFPYNINVLDAMLVEGLHPILEKLVDFDKLKQQIELVRQFKNEETRQPLFGKLMPNKRVAMSNCKAVYEMDVWLKKAF